MNCWHCNTELKWYGDEEFDDYKIIVTNLDCPKCPTSVEVYYNIDEKIIINKEI